MMVQIVICIHEKYKKLIYCHKLALKKLFRHKNISLEHKVVKQQTFMID